ncbi:unnamed protein product [Urochloa decumbens]|uniref:Disease resistance protein At4g27190-like leucine-rich repeats domain-containing protein n=1 Tax=Urochloa decumbens TaxID=240449 RepID=A0ABC9C1L0_9POAL
MRYLIRAADVETAVQQILPYLEDTSNDAAKIIYFDGWLGVGASAVLRAIAEHPPPSLLAKFNKIIHIGSSGWKTRRALQREIADELKLTQQVAADFERQDEEDDFCGVDQASRNEIGGVASMIARSLAQFRCLVVFHNGSNDLIDLTSCGIPHPEVFGTKVLWTFGGQLRHNSEIFRKVLQSSHLCLEGSAGRPNWNALLLEECREIVWYTHKLGLSVKHEVAIECCMYLLSLDSVGGDLLIDYNWATHASSYWVCDGIVEGGQENQAWELAFALQQHIRLEDFSPNNEGGAGPISSLSALYSSPERWVLITTSYNLKHVSRGTTSLFFAPKENRGPLVSLPRDTFHEADQLRVLKLWRCTFSFSSPPFHCCRNLRFLGLDTCKDEQQLGDEEEKKGARAVETFQRLWVLDVRHTDWELDLPLEMEEQGTTNIREVHINKGRIWRSNFAWRRLLNLHKLLLVEPTNSWETGRKDEFMDMDKLELLDLSRNSTIQVLPSLSGATNLKTLVLDGCFRLEHVGPQGLPPSLESFCFNAGADEEHENKAKISRISLAGCARLEDFRLRGSLPNLEELDLSRTSVKMLDLRNGITVPWLENVFLVGCENLRSISWTNTWSFLEMEKHQPRLLCIDTRAREVARKPSSCDPLMVCKGEGEEYFHVFVNITDMRFLQSLEYLWNPGKINMNLCLSSTSKDDQGRSHYKKKMARQLAVGSPLPNKSPAYHDVSTEQLITTEIIDGSISRTTQFQPLEVHVEIGEGISDVASTVSARGRDAIRTVMNRVMSLHVHDSSSITTVTPEHIFLFPEHYQGLMNWLKWCCVERCPKLDTVFATIYHFTCFVRLETFRAAELLMARSIWSRPTGPIVYFDGDPSFIHLRAIHLHFCPRLRYVLPLSSHDALSNQLETLHILYCGDLRQIFPVEEEFLDRIAVSQESVWHKWKSTKGMLAFLKLKDLYLHNLSNLQHICEAKMFAPNLETIYIRGCWGLRRLPATDSSRREDGRPPVAVDCEKDWWDKLEWDGMESGHHPSLFQPLHSKYYKKRHLRGTVLQ